MGLKPRFTDADVAKATLRGLLEIETSIIRLLESAGEEFVKDARDNVKISGAFEKGAYQNDTNVLNSSIGFSVLKDGIPIIENFEGKNPLGMQEAREALARIPKRDYQLIGLAGANYASYLEAMGYNVITSQATIALVNIDKRAKKMAKAYSEKKGVNLDFDFDFTGVSSELR
jgi:hypothetical protein